MTRTRRRLKFPPDPLLAALVLDAVAMTTSAMPPLRGCQIRGATPLPDRGRRRAPARQKDKLIMRLTSVVCFLTAASAHAASAPGAFAATGPTGEYPTSARAEYVFACMKTNGETREALERCSCSIDVIASLLPYDAYVAGETVASMNQEPGEVGGMFRGAKVARDALAQLRSAQAEAEVRCF